MNESKGLEERLDAFMDREDIERARVSSALTEDARVKRHEFDELVKEVALNTALTLEVRNILATFNLLFKVAKFVAAVGAAIAAVGVMVKSIKGM